MRFVIITVVFLIPVVALHAESEAFLNFENSVVLETCEEAASREAEIHAQAVAPLIRQAIAQRSAVGIDVDSAVNPFRSLGVFIGCVLLGGQL